MDSQLPNIKGAIFPRVVVFEEVVFC
jgi:hypothetical protein